MTDPKSLSQQDKQNQNAIPDAEMIQRQLERVLASPELQATERQRKFLQFVVAETIAGRSDEIKGYTVATEVFGRGTDFHQATDPIVSIQANKLRRALERYYLVAGQTDPVRIDIPKGTYVPTFQARADTEPDTTTSRVEDVLPQIDSAWPAVLVRPFQNLTGDSGINFIGTGLATELAIEIARYQEIKVLLYKPQASGWTNPNSMPRFNIDGIVRKERSEIIVAVYLTDSSTMMQLWGETYRYSEDDNQIEAFQEEIAYSIAVKVAGGQGVIAKAISKESRLIPPADLRAYEAILRFYEFTWIQSPKTFYRAFQAVEHATTVEPDSGLIWSICGRLYAIIYAHELQGFETALEKAIEFTEKGVRLNPDNQRTRFNLSLVRMLCNEIPAALIEAEKALALNPRSLLMLDLIGYLLTILGQFERGTAIIRRAMQLNPYYHNHVHHALWLDWIRQEQYEQAHLETLNFRSPDLFWVPLMKAATLGLLGRHAEGRHEAENLLKLKPDFNSRGRVLMQHYIKFDDIVERLIDSLNSVGLCIEH